VKRLKREEKPATESSVAQGMTELTTNNETGITGGREEFSSHHGDNPREKEEHSAQQVSLTLRTGALCATGVPHPKEYPGVIPCSLPSREVYPGVIPCYSLLLSLPGWYIPCYSLLLSLPGWVYIYTVIHPS